MKINSRISALVVLCLLLSMATAPVRARSNAGSLQEGVDAYIKETMDRLPIPGLAVGIVRGDRVLYLQGYGTANVDGDPVTPQTPFMMASVTKSFTALAVQQLASAGKIDLDQPVQHWMLGNRFMQLTHVGRHTGKVRRTILAVLRFEPDTKEILAVSAWKGSDWYYNIQASPALRVESGRVLYVPQQRTLSPEEITAAFMEYRKQHPLFSRIICRIPGWKWDSTYEEFLELAGTLRGVAFRPL